jgi:hypothetical protein
MVLKRSLKELFAVFLVLVVGGAGQALAPSAPADRRPVACADGAAYAPSSIIGFTDLRAARAPSARSLSTIAQVRERTTTDQPDDFPGYQIHLMYVLPKDAADDQLDTNGAITNLVTAMQKWFEGQTEGKRLRFDTYQGVLDITFFRMSRTEAEVKPYLKWILDQIGIELHRAGFNHPNKIYVVVYGALARVADFGFCGLANMPPKSLDAVASLYPLNCPNPDRRLSPFDDSEGWGITLAHEIFHTLGFVAECAPHHYTAHVSDDPRDLLYENVLKPASRGVRQEMLDVNRDDYYGHNNPGCLDLAKSVFLDPAAPDAGPPPLWPIVELPAQDCKVGETLRPQESKTPVIVEFINTTTRRVRVYKINEDGSREPMATLEPYRPDIPPWRVRSRQETFATHPWQVTVAGGECVGFYVAKETTGRVIVR